MRTPLLGWLLSGDLNDRASPMKNLERAFQACEELASAKALGHAEG